MPELVLGPLLRYVDERGATVWVETGGPCEVAVTTDAGATGTSRTWQVAGHHYALVPVTGLQPGTSTEYRVTLDGGQVWPLPGSPYPPSTIRTLADDCASPGTPVRITFGSCRWATPLSDRQSKRSGEVGPDALDTLAVRLSCEPDAERPDVLLLLGDQVYADETSVPVRRYLASRRTPGQPPQDQVADYEEYTQLYYESWLDPEIRWLLSTVPSCMIFDDHDVIDDWNTSDAWRREMRATSWWSERILGGLTSYWVHQHLGNLSPAELADDKLYAAVREADDGAEALREFARQSDADPAFHRWSYRRDFGRVRLLMVDTRAARVLEEGQRAMLAPTQLAWLTDQVTEGACDHLLVGSSLPWLLPRAIHDAEAWNAALCAGGRGARWARWGEKIRRAADLEHWAAFRASFDALADLFARVGGGDAAPATICVLSGDVHHAYIAEARFPDRTLGSRVVQLTCSPVHNAVPAVIRSGFRFGWGRVAGTVGRVLAWHGKVPPTPVDWDRLRGPHFGNQLMTLTLAGRAARVRLERAERPAPGDPAGARPRLNTLGDADLSG